MASSFAEVLAALARVFGSVGARWYLFGAQAAIVHGAARLTADVDVTVQLDGATFDDLARALVAGGFVLRIPDPAFVERTRVVPVTHATGIPADIVLAGAGLEQMFLDRARVMDLDGVAVPVARAEDVIAMKLLAGRAKDVEDVVAILAANADLDMTLLRQTVAMLEGALDQSDLSPALDAAVASAGQRRRA